MKLCSFSVENEKLIGILHDKKIFELCVQPGTSLTDIIGEKNIYEAVGNLAKKREFSISDVVFLPPIDRPQKIFCVGLNYESHRLETGRNKIQYPTIFTRFQDTQVGHLQPIKKPKVSDCLDFEGELAIVIGKKGRYITREDAMRHIAGYSCYNDFTVRDWQRHSHQFTPGKNFPSTGGFGPSIVLADDKLDIRSSRITTSVNGIIKQDAQCGDMIFDLAHLVTYISAFSELNVGDVIATGTPGGVGFKRSPPEWLCTGDKVEVEIEGIGILHNDIIQEE